MMTTVVQVYETTEHWD